MAQIEVCDACRNPRRKVLEYRVGMPRQLYKVILCEEHAKPVEELIKVGTRAPLMSTGGPKVWSMAEIEERRNLSKRFDKLRGK